MADNNKSIWGGCLVVFIILSTLFIATALTASNPYADGSTFVIVAFVSFIIQIFLIAGIIRLWEKAKESARQRKHRRQVVKQRKIREAAELERRIVAEEQRLRRIKDDEYIKREARRRVGHSQRKENNTKNEPSFFTKHILAPTVVGLLTGFAGFLITQAFQIELVGGITIIGSIISIAREA